MSRARSVEQASPGVLRSPPLHRSGADDRREEGEALLVGVIEGVCLFGQPAESLRIFNDALRKPLAAAGYVVGSNTGLLVLLIMGAAARDARDATLAALGRRRPADRARREGETANCAQATPRCFENPQSRRFFCISDAVRDLARQLVEPGLRTTVASRT
jgi:hypothetical protein